MPRRSCEKTLGNLGAHLLGCTSIFSRFDREGDNLKEACPEALFETGDREILAVLGTIDAVAMRPWSYLCRTPATARVLIP